MKTESAASLLCGTLPINQLLSRPGEWRRTAHSGSRKRSDRLLELYTNGTFTRSLAGDVCAHLDESVHVHLINFAGL